MVVNVLLTHSLNTYVKHIYITPSQHPLILIHPLSHLLSNPPTLSLTRLINCSGDEGRFWDLLTAPLMKDLPASPTLTALVGITASSMGRGGRDPSTPTTSTPTTTSSAGSPMIHNLTPEKVVALWGQARARPDTMGLPLSAFQDLVEEETHKSSAPSFPSTASSAASSSSSSTAASSLSSYCHVLLAHASLLRLLSMERHG